MMNPNRFGFSVIKDIVDDKAKLVRTTEVKDFENRSKLLVEYGKGALVFSNGEYQVFGEGRYSLNTGQWFIGKSIQNFISKGETTYSATVYFFDTFPNVYHDLQSVILDCSINDPATGLLVTCHPKIVYSVRISDPLAFFQQYTSTNFDNVEIANYITRQVSPSIRNHIFKTIIEKKSVLAMNADTGSLTGFCMEKARNSIANQGLDLRNVTITTLGIVPSDLNRIQNYHEEIQKGKAFAEKVRVVADQLFDGDVKAASDYCLMDKVAGSEGGGAMNPMALAFAFKLMDNK